MAAKLRITDFRIGFFVGILSKNRSKKKLTKQAITRPPTKASTRANGREEIEKAAIYSAEMGDRDHCEVNYPEGYTSRNSQFNQFLGELM